MALDNALCEMHALGNDTADIFPFNFKIFDEDHLVVYQTDDDGETEILELGVDYTVNEVTDPLDPDQEINDDLGFITLTDGPLPTGYMLDVYRVVPLDQQTDVRNLGRYYPELHEDKFDYLTMALQQLNSLIDRCLKVAVPNYDVETEFDTLVPGSILGVNEAGTAIDFLDAETFRGEQGPVGAGVLRAGIVSIAAAASTVTVTFSSPTEDADYVISQPTFSNVIDTDPIFLQAFVTAKTINGFTVRLNTPTDSANYKLEYSVNVAN